jgi:hypothetical protein
MAASRVEQSPEGEVMPEGLSNRRAGLSARRFGTRDASRSAGEIGWCEQRQEGIDVGDGARLHGRRKALKGTTPRADPA